MKLSSPTLLTAILIAAFPLTLTLNITVLPPTLSLTRRMFLLFRLVATIANNRKLDLAHLYQLGPTRARIDLWR